jgi:hypothetical protein
MKSSRPAHFSPDFSLSLSLSLSRPPHFARTLRPVQEKREGGRSLRRRRRLLWLWSFQRDGSTI